MNDTQPITTPPATTYNPLPSIKEMLEGAFAFYKTHWQIIMGISSIPAALGILELLIKIISPATSLIIALISLVVSYLARLALYDAITQGGTPADGVKGAFRRGSALFIPFAWVLMLVSLATLGGLFLLIVPGILLIGFLGLSSYVLFAENKRGISALITSWQYVSGYWTPVIVRLIFFTLILGLGGMFVGMLSAIFSYGAEIFTVAGLVAYSKSPSLLFGLTNILYSNFIAFPLGIIFMYIVYMSLKKIKGGAPHDETINKRYRKKIVASIVVGTAGLVIIIATSGFAVWKSIQQLLET